MGEPEPPMAPAQERPESSPTSWVVAGIVLIVVGVLWLLDAAGVVPLRWQVVLSAALTIVGVAVVATARRGPPEGLVGTGIVLGALLLVIATPLADLSGVGDRSERPTDVLTAAAGYELGVGSLRVDLTEVGGLDEGVRIPARVGVGDVVVRLPDGVGARVEGRAGIGEVVIVGRSRGGLGVSLEEEIDGDPTIALEVRAGIGRVEVMR